jgi:hypothetical protein
VNTSRPSELRHRAARQHGDARDRQRTEAVFRRGRFGGDRPAATDVDRARVLELLGTGEFPRLAEAYRNDPDLAPPADTFDRGLEWLFDGMQAVLDARRG